jgi:hypothetical protein
LAPGKTEKDGAFGRIGSEYLVENGLQQEDAKGVEYADRRQQQYAGQPLERIGQTIAQETQSPLHAVRSAWGMKVLRLCPGWVRNSIPVLYPAVGESWVFENHSAHVAKTETP